MKLEDFSRDDLIHGMAYFADCAKHTARQIGGLEHEFTDLREHLERAGVDDATALEIIRDYFPMEWETPLVMVSIDLQYEESELEWLDSHLRSCGGIRSHG